MKGMERKRIATIPKRRERIRGARSAMGKSLRINKYLASAGIDSRRKCERLIEEGRVGVNGEKVEDFAVRVDPAADRVTVDGREIEPEREKIILALNKPPGTISAVSDARDRRTVIDIARNKGYRKRLFPVGRLDRDTTGIILLTNDGELTYRLTHPSYKVDKKYRVVVEGRVENETINTIASGIKRGDFQTRKCKIELIGRNDSETEMDVELREGKKRQIKRMFKIFGHRVIGLHRSQFGGLKFDDLGVGELRRLTGGEERKLRELSGLV